MDVEEVLMEAVRSDAVRVPPYPSTAMKLQKLLSGANYSSAQLVEAMRTDAVFAGNILRLANSPFYRRGNPVTSLNAAVGRIGAKELTRLALAATVSNAASQAGVLSSERRRLWREAFANALVCEALARLEGADPEESFVAGLLHDSGSMLIVGCLEDEAGKSQEAPPPLEEVRSAIGRHHASFGAVLASRWQLPQSLTNVIVAHHEPTPGDALCRRVARADRIVMALESHASLDALALADITGASPLACRELAELIPKIPASIAAFDAEAVPVRKPTGKPRQAPNSVSFTLELRGKGGSLVLDVCKATATGFVAIAEGPIPLNRLVEVQVMGTKTSLWAVVQNVRTLGTSQELECTLFALAPEIAREWSKLLEHGSVKAA